MRFPLYEKIHLKLDILPFHHDQNVLAPDDQPDKNESMSLKGRYAWQSWRKDLEAWGRVR